MKLVTFAVAAEGHYVTDGKEYGKAIKFEDGKELAELREITDAEYFELFPDKRPTETEAEATDGGELAEADEMTEAETETE